MTNILEHDLDVLCRCPKCVANRAFASLTAELAIHLDARKKPTLSDAEVIEHILALVRDKGRLQ